MALNVRDMTLAQKYKQPISHLRQRSRDRTAFTTVASGVEMVVLPNFQSEAQIRETGQVIVEGDFIGFPLQPSDDYQEGDVIELANSQRLFITEAPRVVSSDGTDAQWIGLNRESK